MGSLFRIKYSCFESSQKLYPKCILVVLFFIKNHFFFCNLDRKKNHTLIYLYLKLFLVLWERYPCPFFIVIALMLAFVVVDSWFSFIFTNLYIYTHTHINAHIYIYIYVYVDIDIYLRMNIVFYVHVFSSFTLAFIEMAALMALFSRSVQIFSLVNACMVPICVSMHILLHIVLLTQKVWSPCVLILSKANVPEKRANIFIHRHILLRAWKRSKLKLLVQRISFFQRWVLFNILHQQFKLSIL